MVAYYLKMSDFANSFIFVQSVGFVAFVLGIIAFLSQNDRRLKLLLSGQSFILCIHFILLGANGAAVATFITGTRNLFSSFARLKHFAPIFIGLYAGLGYYHYTSWLDILPLLAAITATVGFFYFKDIPMRLTSLFATLLWIIHNAISFSIGPLLMEVVFFFVNLKTIYQLCKTSQSTRMRR